jgi:HEAT repeat protein
MTEILCITGALLIFSLLAVSGKRGNKEFQPLIAGAAEEMDLSPRKSVFGSISAQGIKDKCDVTIHVDRHYKVPLVMIMIKYEKVFHGALHITRETRESRLRKEFGEQDILTGDDNFDDMMLVYASDPAVAASFLSVETRKEIKELARAVEMFHITEKYITLWAGSGTLRKLGLADVVRRLLALIRELRAAADVRRRLVNNIAGETLEPVKLILLGFLTARFSVDDEVKNLLLKLLSDESTAVRMEAALFLGTKGMRCITSLLEKGLLDGGRAARGAVHLGRNRYSQAIPVLMGMYGGADVKMREAILDAAREMGNRDLESFLLKETGNTRPLLALRAVKALASCGTVDAVAPLRRLHKSSDNPIIRAAAEETLLAIRARLGARKTGWLSIPKTGMMDGALSRGGTAGEGALSGKEEDGK